MNQLTEDVQELRAAIETALDEATRFAHDCPARLRDSVRYSLLAGGKRLRPLLVLYSCQACGQPAEQALPAACAIEMIHCYSLIHDDLPAMDDDALRRGQPTNHIQFDEATAILAGDGLLTYAFEILAKQISDPQLAIQCCLELARAAGVCGMVGGQQADLEAEKRFDSDSLPSACEKSVKESSDSQERELGQLKAIHRRKTGRLITCAVRMGAILGRATPEQLDAVTKYGDAVGLAFQIADDVLDCVGTVEKMGKGVRKDDGRAKLTYPGLLGLEESRRQAAELLQEALSALNVFGTAAASLEAVARYSIDREH